ncbi:squalene synthetase-like protein, partial [Cryomyces antarcticus]
MARSKRGASPKSRYFSLADEAQNTERHHSRWSSDQKLRNSKVTFVSAAFSQPTNGHEEIAEEKTTSDLAKQIDGAMEESQHAMAQMALQGSRESMPPDIFHDTDHDNRLLHETEAVQQDQAHCAKEDTEASRPPPYIIDTVGSGFKQTGLTPPAIRSISPTPSNSSEEVVLFHGRNKTRSKTDEVFEFQTHAAAPVQELLGCNFVGDSLLKALENSTQDGSTPAALPLRITQPPHQPLNRNLAVVGNEHNAQVSWAENFTATGWAARPPVWVEKPTAWAHRGERSAQASKARPTHNNSEAGNRRSKNARKRQNRQLTRDKDILEDYVANLRANGEFDIHQQSTHRQRDLKLPNAD